jgi:leucyl aminopeptidase
MLPTSTNITIKVQTKLPPQADAIVVFIAEGGRIAGDAPHLLDEETMASVDRLIRAGVCRGKLAEIAFDLIDMDIDRGKVRRVFLAGIGKPDEIDQEAVRRSAGAIAKAVKKHRMKNIAIVPPVLRASGDSGARSAVTGFLLASFQYDEYRGAGQKKDDDENGAPINLTFLAMQASLKHVRDLVQHGQIIAESQNFARTIAHRPGNDINPPALAKVAADMARQVGLKCRVLDEKQLKKLGMGGILAVRAGSSSTPPRLIVLEHKIANRKSKIANPLLIVGKAITFDTGGISIKPAEKMGKMVFDKCGGMTVLGVMAAIARLKLPLHVVGILSSAENHISENAFRPGDILKMYNGVTVEVTNTDAEGRLVLGDALAWGIETFKPAAVIDLATLTGGVIVALGRGMAGVMSNDDGLVNELNEISKRSGEKFWRLPLGKEQREQIKSEVADIVNSAGRDGHPLQGGAFLSYFVPESLPWAHLDIAGVADTEKELPYYRSGATGWGVRTLVEWATRRADSSRA